MPPVSHLASRISCLADRVSCLLLILLAFALRVYALDAKGLSYDEAATALMARATPSEIIAFHWRAAFEHPPLWQLLMHGWSLLAGQSEFALRFLPVLAGTLLIPFMGQMARRLPHSQLTIDNLQLIIVITFAPILLYYSQEARMYALVVTLAVAALVTLSRLTADSEIGKRTPRRVIGTFILLHWALLGLHYYSALLVLAEGLFCLLWLISSRATGRTWARITITLGLAILPLVGWLAFAPGFHDTLRIVLTDSTPKPSALTFLAALWRELSFASVRWEVAASRWGYLWLPLVGLGIVAVLWPRRERQPVLTGQPCRGRSCEIFVAETTLEPSPARLLLWLPLLVALVPIGLSALLFPALATRYLLYVVPALLLLLALGIGLLQRVHWTLGAMGLLLALVVPALALPHYFGGYQKSAYREMAAYLSAHRQADEAVLLEAPRQHLLAKYYLPSDTPLYTAPALALPPYWPVNAPPVVPEEMDDLLQALLRDYRGVWLSLTAENEVDPGEFVPKYLTAVAYERDCEAWLDVRLCHFSSPQPVRPSLTTRINAAFNADLFLQQADLALATNRAGNALLTTLYWRAAQQPRIDYRVTLRLLDATGTVVSQRDNFPIGPLLPPTTWQAGDEKPGYMALPLPDTLPHGTYQLVVNLYDPVDKTTIPHTVATAPGLTTTAPISVAVVTLGPQIVLHAP